MTASGPPPDADPGSGNGNRRFRILPREGFDRLIEELRRRGFQVIAPTEREVRSSSRRLSVRMSCRSGSARTQDGAPTGCAGATTRPCSASPTDPSPGSDCCIRRPCASGAPRRVRTGTGRSRPSPTSPLRWPSSASAPATCMRSGPSTPRCWRSSIPIPTYSRRREGAFIVAVNCGVAGGTCFCVSTGTGPQASFGFDLALTELIDDDGHRFVVDVGSERGAEVAAAVATSIAADDDVAAAVRTVERTAADMGGPWTSTASRTCSTATSIIPAGTRCRSGA